MGDDDGSVEGDESGGPTTTKKSERKRQREKDRRKEMKEGFVELAQLLAQIEPDDTDSQSRKRKRRGSEDGSTDLDSSGMTRIDLISRAIDTIRKLHAENMDLKRSHGGGDGKEVLVMVPTLQPSAGGVQPTVVGSNTSSTPAQPPTAAQYQAYYAQQSAGQQVDPRDSRRAAPQTGQPPFYQQVPGAAGTQEHPSQQAVGPPPAYGYPPWGAAPHQQYLHGPPQQQFYGEHRPGNPPMQYPYGPPLAPPQAASMYSLPPQAAAAYAPQAAAQTQPPAAQNPQNGSGTGTPHRPGPTRS